MVRNLKQIEGRALQARDGIVGEVKDVYFDDHDWHVRYLVVETGSWLHRRTVLIAPDAFSGLDWGLQVFPVDLTIEQIRQSPSIDTDKPVSRQNEELLRQYYGWAPYWDPVFADAGLPNVPVTAETEPGRTDGNQPLRPRGNPHLRSANDTRGYDLAAADGGIGHLEDFLIDENGWRIRYLVIDTRNWWAGKKVVIAPAWVRDVSWERRAINVDHTRAEIESSPVYEPQAPWSPSYAADLHDHYGRPRYRDWEHEHAAPPADHPR